MAHTDAVTVLLPAFEEAERIVEVLRAVAQAVPGAQLVVVDDGSRDATAEVARRAGARVLRHPFNLGYGAALQTGYKDALARGAMWLVQMDADGQHDAADLEALLRPLREDRCDLVIGSRFVAPSDYEMGALRRTGRRLFELLGRLSGLEVSDPTSGFQAMNRRVLALYGEDFFPADYPDIDVLVMARRRGIRILEVPVSMRASPRRSTLHGGLRVPYYAYKMLLSWWAAVGRRRRP
ncbi:glycosyltransferase family 2 protein [Myxococcota bacterium]|nr:glycosyltransferase family 2 protein [Myxococcota bacterium]